MISDENNQKFGTCVPKTQPKDMGSDWIYNVCR